MSTLPALSLWQPWASLWVCSSPRVKCHETRHWRPPARYIGRRILVHAAKTVEGIKDALDDPALSALCAQRFGQWWDTTLPLGGFVGSVLLASAERTTETIAKTDADLVCGNWAPGRFALLGLEPDAWPLKPARGYQGFWLAEFP